MRPYVCGFMFSPDRSRVLLIRKNRPTWQAGKLNGVGGKVEPGETAHDAMVREFREEAGLLIPTWQPVLHIIGNPSPRDETGWRATFFRAFHDPAAATSQTDELLEIHPTTPVPAGAIANLRWIIPMLLDDDVAGGECGVATA